MFLKKSSLLNIPIIEQRKKKIVGWVKDIILSKGNTRIEAFIVKEGNWLRDTKILRYKDITNISELFVEVKDRDDIKGVSIYPELQKLLNSHQSFDGTNVISMEGKDLGYIVDYILDINSGKIFCFILSQGLLDDIIEGRQLLPYCEGMNKLEDKLIIKDSLISTLQNTRTGGLRNILQ